MKLLKTITLLLVLVPALAVSPAKNKKPYKLPAAFNQARYAYVEAVDGQEFDPRLNPEDLQAISDVYKALQDWKRYVLTVRREEADLIFVVRKGRLAEAGVGVRAGTGGQGAPGQRLPGNGVAVGGEVGPPDDLLEVYYPNPNDGRGTLLWQRSLADGLVAPDIPLFRQLKNEVESSYPTQAAGKAPKP